MHSCNNGSNCINFSNKLTVMILTKTQHCSHMCVIIEHSLNSAMKRLLYFKYFKTIITIIYHFCINKSARTIKSDDCLASDHKTQSVKETEAKTSIFLDLHFGVFIILLKMLFYKFIFIEDITSRSDFKYFQLITELWIQRHKK